MKEIKITGYKPREWQRELHCALDNAYQSGRRYLVKAHRQCGKSYSAQYELLRFSLNYRDVCSMYLAPTQNQARKMFKDLEKKVANKAILESANSTLLEMRFVNGSSILFRSAEMRDNLRGYTINGILIVDEAAFISDEVYDIVLPSTNVSKAPILMISTPRFKTGRYYEFYISQDERFKSFDWSLYDTSEFLSKEQIELYRKTMSTAKFTNEILGEFYDEGGELFTGIIDCLIDEPSHLNGLYIAVDWGTGTDQDNTAITCLNSDNELCWIKYFNNKTPTEQVSVVTDLIKKYNPLKVTIEQNSIGLVYYDMLVKKNPNIRINKFQTTNKSKNRIINNLQAAIENGKIKLLPDDELLLELKAYEMQVNKKTGNVTFNAPSGFKDDCVMSLAICYDSISSNKCNYKMSFI